MQTIRQYEISLPQEMAEFIEAKVQSEHYASVSEVLCDGVRELMAREAKFEKWLREEVVASYDEYKADPSRAIPIEDVMERLRARRSERANKQQS